MTKSMPFPTWGRVVFFCLFLLVVQTMVSADDEPFRVQYRHDGSSIYYQAPSGTTVWITENIPGFNLGPRLIEAETGSWVIWEINREARAGIGIYDLIRHQAREHMLEGISDIGQMEALIQDDHLSDLFFIAKGKCVDIYHYRTDTLRMVNLTGDTDVEHRFSLEGEGERMDIEVECIDNLRQMRFDRLIQKVIVHGKTRWRKDRKRLEPRASVRENDSASSVLDDYFVALGDSITAGKMYLPEEGDTVLTGGQYRPLYAYGAQLVDSLTEDGYQVDYVNAGVGEDTTARGRDRIDMVLDSGSYTTLIVMLGTNDMIINTILVDVSLENMRYIIDAAQKREMRVLICTIPPSNDKYIGVSALKRPAYNEGLRQLADDEGANLVEVFNSFMQYDDTYVVLLEERDDTISSGCHPNPEGHALIAGLMKTKYDNFLLKPPEAVASSSLTELNGSKVTWQAPSSKNIDHYVFEFGTAAGSFPNRIELEGYEVQFILLQRYFTNSSMGELFRIVGTGPVPQVVFQRGATVFYRIKTVNTKGIESRYCDAGSFVLGQ